MKKDRGQDAAPATKKGGGSKRQDSFVAIPHPSGWPSTPDWEDVAFWRHEYTVFMRVLVRALKRELQEFKADPTKACPSLQPTDLRDSLMKHVLECNEQLRSLDLLRKGKCRVCGKRLPPQPAGRKYCKKQCGLLYRQRKHQFNATLREFSGMQGKIPKKLFLPIYPFKR
jgi:predicted nucleic acid-binding Zn ribbon protein